MARIGIDIDGVLYDFAGEFTRYAAKRLNVDTLPQPTVWDFHTEQWGLTSEQLAQLMGDALLSGELWSNGRPLHHGGPWYRCDGTDSYRMQDALWKLSDAGHTIVLVTDRLQGTPYERAAKSATREWLRKVGANYDELHFASDKTQFNCDIFLDDRPGAVPSMRLAGINAVYMQQAWNADYPYPRVSSWAQFITFVEENTYV